MNSLLRKAFATSIRRNSHNNIGKSHTPTSVIIDNKNSNPFLGVTKVYQTNNEQFKKGLKDLELDENDYLAKMANIHALKN